MKVFFLCLAQGRICRKAGKSKKSFSRKEAEATFKSLVKTHEKYGWVTPPVSDGWCYQPALDKNAEQKYCDISSVLYTAHPFLLQLQLHTMNVKETSKLFMSRCVYRGREKKMLCRIIFQDWRMVIIEVTWADAEIASFAPIQPTLSSASFHDSSTKQQYWKVYPLLLSSFKCKWNR